MMVPIGDELGQTQLVLLNKNSSFADKLLASMKMTAKEAEATLEKTEKAITDEIKQMSVPNKLVQLNDGSYMKLGDLISLYTADQFRASDFSLSNLDEVKTPLYYGY